MLKGLPTAFWTLVAGLVLAAPLHAAPGPLTVKDAWSRATVPGAQTGALFFEVDNSGAADELVAVEGKVSRLVEMHESTMEGGMMRMRPVAHVVVPAHGVLRFRPGSYHVMLVDLARPLVAGQHFSVTLRFRNAGAITTEATVRELGDDGSGSH